VTLADEILLALRRNPQGCSDAELALLLGKNHQHVNQTCGRLAVQGRIERDSGQRPIMNRIRPPAEAQPRERSINSLVPEPQPRSPFAGAATRAGQPPESATWVARDFVLVGSLELERDEDGRPRELLPQSLYAKAATKPLNRHGAGPFCRFRLAEPPTSAGVYVLTENRDPVYVGICEDFSRRWGQTGYGSISPVNCFVGGQSTNCKINARVLEGSGSTRQRREDALLRSKRYEHSRPHGMALGKPGSHILREQGCASRRMLVTQSRSEVHQHGCRQQCRDVNPNEAARRIAEPGLAV
jgi:hypothetical protein